jgi:hypothetical protein
MPGTDKEKKQGHLVPLFLFRHPGKNADRSFFMRELLRNCNNKNNSQEQIRTFLAGIQPDYKNYSFLYILKQKQ